MALRLMTPAEPGTRGRTRIIIATAAAALALTGLLAARFTDLWR